MSNRGLESSPECKVIPYDPVVDGADPGPTNARARRGQDLQRMQVQYHTRASMPFNSFPDAALRTLAPAKTTSPAPTPAGQPAPGETTHSEVITAPAPAETDRSSEARKTVKTAVPPLQQTPTQGGLTPPKTTPGPAPQKPPTASSTSLPATSSDTSITPVVATPSATPESADRSSAAPTGSVPATTQQLRRSARNTTPSTKAKEEEEAENARGKLSTGGSVNAFLAGPLPWTMNLDDSHPPLISAISTDLEHADRTLHETVASATKKKKEKPIDLPHPPKVDRFAYVSKDGGAGGGTGAIP